MQWCNEKEEDNDVVRRSSLSGEEVTFILKVHNHPYQLILFQYSRTRSKARDYFCYYLSAIRRHALHLACCMLEIGNLRGKEKREGRF